MSGIGISSLATDVSPLLGVLLNELRQTAVLETSGFQKYPNSTRSMRFAFVRNSVVLDIITISCTQSVIARAYCR